MRWWLSYGSMHQKKTHIRSMVGWWNPPLKCFGFENSPVWFDLNFFFSLLRFESPPKVLLRVSRVIWNRSGLSVLGLPQRVSQPHGRLNRSAPPPGEPQLANRQGHPAERETDSEWGKDFGVSLHVGRKNQLWGAKKKLEIGQKCCCGCTILWTDLKNVDGRILRSPVSVLKS